jgi:hypothetical protein
VDPRAESGARILIKKSDRDVSSLEKSSTDFQIKSLVGLTQEFLHIIYQNSFDLIKQSVTKKLRTSKCLWNSKSERKRNAFFHVVAVSWIRKSSTHFAHYKS